MKAKRVDGLKPLLIQNELFLIKICPVQYFNNISEIHPQPIIQAKY